MKKIFLIVGARPNFMKAAPLFKAFKNDSNFDVRLIHTGQHYDVKMSDVFFKELGIPKPDVNLEVGSGAQGWQTAEIIKKFEDLVIKDRPDWVIVFGDVNSTLACALVCSKLGIKVAHVEAGLRSFDRRMPEEVNRILTDQIADALFTPSADGDKNLIKEGISKEKIFLVGNIMVDTLLSHRDAAVALKPYQKLNLDRKGYAYLTLHRPSNVDQKESLAEILEAVDYIQQQMPVVFPLHPRTKIKVAEFGLEKKLTAMKNLKILEPVGYLENIGMQEAAAVVLTDSGGMQEETTVLGVACLTLRENTERPITISEGTSQLVWNKKDRIIKAFENISGDCKPKIPKYWDGETSARIVKVIKRLEVDN
jgi:UDP-N-acetylglucosamine 2-epimerase (non-hydrolysing)